MKKSTKEAFKKNFLKVFYVAAFLFITIFYVLPYLVQTSTYFHEKAHQKAFDKYGISNNYDFNLLETIYNFYNPNVKSLGLTKFDLDAYLLLDKYERAEIHVAGIISDLKFLFLISIYLIFSNIFVFYKIKVRKEYNLNLVLAINWILFMWLLVLIQITVANITYFSGDIYKLIDNLVVP